MLNLFVAELYKLRRTMVLWVALSLPLIHTAIQFVQVFGRRQIEPIRDWLASVSGFWALLMIPLVIALTCACVAGVEYENNTWPYLLSTGHRSRTYFAKLAVISFVLLGASVAHLCFSVLASLALVRLVPDMLDAPLSDALLTHLRTAGFIYLASCAQMSILWWLSTRTRRFIAPILAALLAVGVSIPLVESPPFRFVHPWLYPLGVVVGHGPSGSNTTLLLLASAVAIVSAAAGCVDFGRRQM